MALLTARQKQVCDLICMGQTSKEIARRLEVSPRTIEDHRTDIYAKLDVPNSTALVHKILSARIAELEAMHGAE